MIGRLERIFSRSVSAFFFGEGRLLPPLRAEFEGDLRVACERATPFELRVFLVEFCDLEYDARFDDLVESVRVVPRDDPVERDEFDDRPVLLDERDVLEDDCGERAFEDVERVLPRRADELDEDERDEPAEELFEYEFRLVAISAYASAFLNSRIAQVI